VARSKKVRREDLYELSYCYYQAKSFAKAIDGFKQLSGKDDSLSQHAMYLLGDAYLKTGQKSNARNAFLFRHPIAVIPRKRRSPNINTPNYPMNWVTRTRP
jgi:TolA-binding protein